MTVDSGRNIFSRFAVLFALFYGLFQLVSHVPAVQAAYRDHYIRMTDRLFGDFRKEGIVKANINPDGEERELDVMIMLSSVELYSKAVQSGTNVRVAKTYIYSRILGMFPLILFLSLALASPLNWKQRLIALAAGIALVEIFIIFRLWLHLTISFKNYDWLNIVNFTDRYAAFIDMLGGFFISNVVIGVIVPIVIWVLVAVVPFPRSAINSSLNASLRQYAAAPKV